MVLLQQPGLGLRFFEQGVDAFNNQLGFDQFACVYEGSEESELRAVWLRQSQQLIDDDALVAIWHAQANSCELKGVDLCLATLVIRKRGFKALLSIGDQVSTIS